jgi:cell division protein FtsQ
MSSRTTTARRSSARAADRRIIERRREIVRGRVRRRRRVLLGMVLLVALGVALWRVSGSSLFGLSDVEVTGARNVTEAQVVAASGVRVGEPVLRLDLSKVRKRVERLPWVAHAAVVRVPPSGIRIEVTERIPAATVTGAGRWWLVAGDGVVLRATTARPGAIPYVSQVRTGRLAPGLRLGRTGPFANALTALRGMDPRLQRVVVGVRAPTEEGLAFALRGGGELLYGVAERQAAKDEAALLLLSNARTEKRQVVRIDVRAPKTPVMQAKGIGPS